MLGYIFKDMGKTHFENKTFGDLITDAIIQKGIAAYAQLKTSFMDGRIQLNRSNLFLRAFAYYMANKERLAGMSLAYILVHMLNSGEYMFSPTLIMSSSGQMRRDAAEAYWFIIMGGVATEATISSIIYLVDFRSASNPPGHRAPDRAFDVAPFTITRPAAPVPLNDFEPVNIDTTGEAGPSGEAPGGTNTPAPGLTRLERIMTIARMLRGKQPAGFDAAGHDVDDDDYE